MVSNNDIEEKIIYVDINKVIPYDKNPRKNDEAVKYVANSIKEFGFRNPIIVDKDFVVAAGHTRLKATKKLKLKKVPIVIADDLTEEQIKAFRLADNKVAEFADWDIDILGGEMDDILGIDMSDFGFDFKELSEEKPKADDDEDGLEEIPAEPRVVRGDIWQLGRHRLMCGDSTSITDIETLISGADINLVLTDPPYGINVVNDNGNVGTENFGVVKHGNYSKVIADDTTDTAKEAYSVISTVCDKQILWGGNYFTDFLPFSDSYLIWDKRCDSGIKNTFADGEMAWCSFHTPIRIYHQLWNGMIREGEHDKRIHPTQKPVRMLSEIIQDFSEENDNVLDVFGGSGSTLIACEKTKRTCYINEISEEYCTLIIDRWEKLTGEKAVRLEPEEVKKLKR